MSGKEKILELKNVVYSFKTYGGVVQAVRDVSFDVRKDQLLKPVKHCQGKSKKVTDKK